MEIFIVRWQSAEAKTMPAGNGLRWYAVFTNQQTKERVQAWLWLQSINQWNLQSGLGSQM